MPRVYTQPTTYLIIGATSSLALSILEHLQDRKEGVILTGRGENRLKSIADRLKNGNEARLVEFYSLDLNETAQWNDFLDWLSQATHRKVGHLLWLASDCRSDPIIMNRVNNLAFQFILTNLIERNKLARGATVLYIGTNATFAPAWLPGAKQYCDYGQTKRNAQLWLHTEIFTHYPGINVLTVRPGLLRTRQVYFKNPLVRGLFWFFGRWSSGIAAVIMRLLAANRTITFPAAYEHRLEQLVQRTRRK